MASVALASLTESYTDSEEEYQEKNNSESHSKDHNHSHHLVPRVPKVTKLVHYYDNDESVISDEESGNEAAISPGFVKPQIPGTILSNLKSAFDINLPPEPSGRCSNELQEKIVELTLKKERKGYDMNKIIQQRKEFRNPSIYEKLIQFCSINEFGTNYEPRLYDPLKWDRSSYYDELAKAQKADMEQREKERRERTKVEFLIGTAKKVYNGVGNEDDKKRKSKWDQVSYTVSGASRSQSAATSLTSSITGTKGTVISAFGSLPKKAKS